MGYFEGVPWRMVTAPSLAIGHDGLTKVTGGTPVKTKLTYTLVLSVLLWWLPLVNPPMMAYGQGPQPVTLYDSHIVPAQITASLGKKVSFTITNSGSEKHNFVIPDFYIFTHNLNPGETVSVSFNPDRQGTFPFYSDTGGQPQPGLRGTLVVR